MLVDVKCWDKRSFSYPVHLLLDRTIGILSQLGSLQLTEDNKVFLCLSFCLSGPAGVLVLMLWLCLILYQSSSEGAVKYIISQYLLQKFKHQKFNSCQFYNSVISCSDSNIKLGDHSSEIQALLLNKFVRNTC